MAYKPVGVDENSLFPTRVMTKLNTLFAPFSLVAAAAALQPPVRFSAAVASIATTGTDEALKSRTITEARMRCESAPVGSALIAVVQHWNGTTWTDITTLTIAAGSTTQHVVTGLSQAQSAGHRLRLNVTSVGSTTAAKNVVVDITTT